MTDARACRSDAKSTDAVTAVVRFVSLFALVSLSCLSADAGAQGVFVHTVHEGETLSSIAQRYYGDPNFAAVLASENNTLNGEEVLVGRRVAVPYVVQHQVVEGDTWATLAERYYGAASRAFVLMQVNRHVRKQLDPGALLKVPYPVRARVGAEETLLGVAQRLGVRRHERKWIRRFNPKVRIEEDARVLVPMARLDLSDEGIAVVRRTAPSSLPDKDAQERQQHATESLRRVKKLREDGEFTELVAVGNSLLGGGSLTSVQRVTVFRALAESYVALGRPDLAIRSFKSALEIDASLELEPVQTSPKVMAVFEAAKRRRR